MNDEVRKAEQAYEDALNQLGKLGLEPTIHSLPCRISPLLAVLQGGIEMNEGLPLDSDTMKKMVETINEIRTEAGLETIESPLDLSGQTWVIGVKLRGGEAFKVLSNGIEEAITFEEFCEQVEKFKVKFQKE